MKVWLLEIWVYKLDDEYGNIYNYYRENKVFDKREKAFNYLRDFRKTIKQIRNPYDITTGGCGVVYDESKITEVEL